MSAVDTALMSKLQSAGAVSTTAPGGVYQMIAPPGVVEPFVIVQLMAHEDTYAQNGGHIEVGRYLVKAVGKGSLAVAVSAAAQAIYITLQDQPLTIPGYAHMLIHREERIRYVEVDGPILWQHGGGIYAVWASQ
jgi:hypothetical protein